MLYIKVQAMYLVALSCVGTVLPSSGRPGNYGLPCRGAGVRHGDQ